MTSIITIGYFRYAHPLIQAESRGSKAYLLLLVELICESSKNGRRLTTNLLARLGLTRYVND